MAGFDVRLAGAAKMRMTAAGGELEAFGAGTHRLRFGRPVAAGETVMLELAAQKGPAGLAGVRWLPLRNGG